MRMNMKCGFLSGVVVASVVVSVAGPAAAHHSFAVFDIRAEKTIVGTIKQMDWTNPHTWVWVNVPNDQGGVDTWGFEGMSPNYLARRGWSRSTLKVGDKISIMFRPLKDGSKGGMFVRATRPDGQILTMSGQPSDEKN